MSGRASAFVGPDTGVAGFTLVESMVALLVLSIGLIGIAALHGESLAASRSASYRSQAVQLAVDMADRMRANPQALLAYAGEPAASPCGLPLQAGGTACSPAQMAAHDLFVWHALLAERLPGASGSISVEAAIAPASYRISVSWTDPASDTPLEFRLDSRPTGHKP